MNEKSILPLTIEFYHSAMIWYLYVEKGVVLSTPTVRLCVDDNRSKNDNKIILKIVLLLFLKNIVLVVQEPDLNP